MLRATDALLMTVATAVSAAGLGWVGCFDFVAWHALSASNSKHNGVCFAVLPHLVRR